MSLSPGHRLGPYEVVAPIGAGGMGEVVRARDTRLDREVAIKVLPESFASEPDRRARFEREAKAIAALSHPNILVVYDTGVDDDRLFVVTELLEGETLRERLATALPVRKVIDRVVYAPSSGAADPLAETLSSVDGRTLYFKSHDADGRAAIWNVPASGGRPARLVRFLDTHSSPGQALAAGAGRFFFRLEDHQADVWVADITVR